MRQRPAKFRERRVKSPIAHCKAEREETRAAGLAKRRHYPRHGATRPAGRGYGSRYWPPRAPAASTAVPSAVRVAPRARSGWLGGQLRSWRHIPPFGRRSARPNPSLKRGPATAATAWPLQALFGIVLPRPVGVCLHGPLSSNVRPHRHAGAASLTVRFVSASSALGATATQITSSLMHPLRRARTTGQLRAVSPGRPLRSPTSGSPPRHNLREGREAISVSSSAGAAVAPERLGTTPPRRRLPAS